MKCPVFRRFEQNCERRLLPSSGLSAPPTVCQSLRPSARKQLGSHWTDFHEIYYLKIFSKYVEKIQVSLISDMNNGYSPRRPTNIYENMLLNSSWNEKCSRQIFREKAKHVLRSIFFPSENCAVFGMVWKKKNIVQPDRSQMTI